MISPSTCLLTLWAIWLFGWLIASWATAPTVSRQSTTACLVHSVPIWGGAALLFLQSPLFGALLQPLLPHHGWIAWLGNVLVIAGLGGATWARVHLGRLWDGAVALKAEHTVVRTGPYALTRHPIYSGLLIALTGTAIAKGSYAAFAGLFLLAIGIFLKVRQEEQLLLEHFGAAYQTYQRQVPAFLPRLRRGSGTTSA